MDSSASFNATLYQIKTEPAGGWRITFDVSQSDSEEVMKLSEMRQILLSVGIVVIPKEKDFLSNA